MKIVQSTTFSRISKKLHPNQKKALDKAVSQIIKNPKIGDPKVGDLEGVRVFKFKIENLNWLLAYQIIGRNKITLLLLGPHENFYRKLKD
jgi:addiction module RelE/StbE family toxin